jgi:SAM-dependent methyltransferase
MGDAPTSAAAFVGSVPDIYERHLGPMYFVPYAQDLARRAQIAPDARVLELACGTGLLTRELLRVLPAGATLTATDLNDPMLDVARRLVRDERVKWRQADAMALPFETASFDAVVCQFGVMFFPDKVAAAAEARRVLAAGGAYLFNVWGTHADNPLSRVAQQVVQDAFPTNTPGFYHVPWGYHDRRPIEDDLRRGGFKTVTIEQVDLIARSASAEHAATGLVQGTPMAAAVMDRGDEITRRMAAAFRREFGEGEIATPTRAYVVTAS